MAEAIDPANKGVSGQEPTKRNCEGHRSCLQAHGRTVGEGRGPSSLEDPQAFSGVGSWGPGFGFSTFCCLFWPPLLPSRYFHNVLGTDLVFTCLSPLPVPRQFFSSPLAEVVKLACGVLPSSRGPWSPGVTLCRPTWWVGEAQASHCPRPVKPSAVICPGHSYLRRLLSSSRPLDGRLGSHPPGFCIYLVIQESFKLGSELKTRVLLLLLCKQ